MSKVMTPEFRVSFAHVFEAHAVQEGQKAKYSVTMLFPPDADLTRMKAAAQEAVKAKWGDKPPKGMRNPFRDASEKELEGYEEGWTFVSARSDQRPGLVDQNLEDIIDRSDFYSGCWARATVVAFAYDHAGNRGVSFGLNNIQKLRDDEGFSGRSTARDDFDAVEGAGTSDAGSMFD